MVSRQVPLLARQHVRDVGVAQRWRDGALLDRRLHREVDRPERRAALLEHLVDDAARYAGCWTILGVHELQLWCILVSRSHAQSE